MLTQHIALVPVAGGVDASELARVSAALQKQVTRDLAPLWGISATVDAFPELEDVPLGYWPILLSTGEASAETGRFCDENGQPYAHLLLTPHWSVVASRTCLEMLVNPSGNRSVVCASPRYDQGQVQMLVEICAACEDPSHAYVINDVLVSDFCTPGFYESDAVSAQERCSFYGSIAAPLQLLIGGHLTWFDSASDSWWLRTQHDGEPVDTRLGTLDAEIGSVRELVRRYTPPGRRTWTLSHEAFETRARLIREQAALAAHARARRFRGLLGRFDAHEPFEEVTREFELSDVSALVPRPPETAAPPGVHDESASEDEPSAPLELITAAAARAELPPPPVARVPRVTEGSVVASFVLPPPDPLPRAAEAAAPQLAPAAPTRPELASVRESSTDARASQPAPAALTPARPEQVLASVRESSAEARAQSAAGGASRPAPSSSSIAPATLALMAPERSREGLDARLVAGALVIAVLAVLAFTQRRASSTPVVSRPAAAPPAAPAAAVDAGAAPLPLAPAVVETAPGPLAAPPNDAAKTAPPGEPAPLLRPLATTRRPARAAQAPQSKPARSPNEPPIEALFETRR